MFEAIPLKEFETRTGIVAHAKLEAGAVVSLRHLMPKSISAIQVMPRNYLKGLIRSIPLEGDPTARPYQDADIQLVRMDPNNLVIGQTFVERGKYQGLLEEFSALFDADFCVTRGTAKCNALIVYGKTIDGQTAIAHYVPPIIEATGDTHFLLDGVHRDFLVMRVGTTIESVLIRGVTTPLPCTPQGWDSVQVVNQKPPRERRFWNLKPELFRNLKHVGIDG